MGRCKKEKFSSNGRQSKNINLKKNNKKKNEKSKLLKEYKDIVEESLKTKDASSVLKLIEKMINEEHELKQKYSSALHTIDILQRNSIENGTNNSNCCRQNYIEENLHVERDDEVNRYKVSRPPPRTFIPPRLDLKSKSTLSISSCRFSFELTNTINKTKEYNSTSPNEISLKDAKLGPSETCCVQLHTRTSKEKIQSLNDALKHFFGGKIFSCDLQVIKHIKKREESIGVKDFSFVIAKNNIAKTVYGCCLTNIDEELCRRINLLVTSNQLDFKNLKHLELTLVGDGSNDITTIGLYFNQVSQPHTFHNILVCLIYTFSDCRDPFVRALEEIKSQLESLKSITYDGCEKKIKLCCIGDMKFLYSMTGLKTIISHERCLYGKNLLPNKTFKDIKVKYECSLDLEQYSSTKFLSDINVDKIFPPLIQLKLELWNDIVTLTRRILVDINKKQIWTKIYTSIQNYIHKSGEKTFHYTNNDVEKIFKTNVKLFSTLTNEEKNEQIVYGFGEIMKHFSIIFQKESQILNLREINEIQRNITSLIEFIKNHKHFNRLPYTLSWHTFHIHLTNTLRRFPCMLYASEQGIQNLHPSINRLCPNLFDLKYKGKEYTKRILIFCRCLNDIKDKYSWAKVDNDFSFIPLDDDKYDFIALDSHTF